MQRKASKPKTRAKPKASKARAKPARASAKNKGKATQAAKRRAALEKKRAADKQKKLAAEKKRAIAKKKQIAADKKRAADKQKKLAAEKKRKLAAAKKLKLAAQKKQKALRAARLEAEREKARARREREQEIAARARERAAEARAREKARLAKQREREKVAAERERERQNKLKAKEAARLKAEREIERKRQLAAKAAERERAQREKAAERERVRLEKEAERARLRAEKEAERERIRQEKEAERLRREAEREAYRKAKEAERERIRQEKEAARRALEGKVARATRRAQRAASARGATRVYRPDLIPNQSGTRRRVDGEAPPPRLRSSEATPEPAPHAEPAPPPKALPPERIDERYAQVVERLAKTDEAFQRDYATTFEMSWIYHDSALEGVVYTRAELETAFDTSLAVVPDSSMQPVVDEIRRHRAAIELVRDLGEKKRAQVTVDVVKKIYLTLRPDDGDVKNVKYRKDVPQHRLYFHEYAPPDKIAYKVRQVVDWLNGPEPKKMKSPIRIAARAHFDLLRVFPFANDSGKVSRLLMNLLLMRSGYPPAIVHTAERQKYYEALKGALPVILNMVNEAIVNGLLSIEKRLDEYETRSRSMAY